MNNNDVECSSSSCDCTVMIAAKELDYLYLRDKKLAALETMGVDNWEWYDDAMALLVDEDD